MIYLNGWFPGIRLDGCKLHAWYLHVSDPATRLLGEWLWVGRAFPPLPPLSLPLHDATTCLGQRGKVADVNGLTTVAQEARL